MRTLTIDFHNWYHSDKNMLIYQKARDAYGQTRHVVWRKFKSPHNSLTVFDWQERYCFCIGKIHGNQRITTIASTDARPGDQTTIEVDYRTQEMTFGRVIQGGRNNDFTLTSGMFNPMAVTYDDCVGLGIDNKLICAEQLRPAMNYIFAPLPEYYIAASDKFNEGDIVTEELERIARKLEFPASGKLEIQLHDSVDHETWIIKPM